MHARHGCALGLLTGRHGADDPRCASSAGSAADRPPSVNGPKQIGDVGGGLPLLPSKSATRFLFQRHRPHNSFAPVFRQSSDIRAGASLGGCPSGDRLVNILRYWQIRGPRQKSPLGQDVFCAATDLPSDISRAFYHNFGWPYRFVVVPSRGFCPSGQRPTKETVREPHPKWYRWTDAVVMLLFWKQPSVVLKSGGPDFDVSTPMA